MEHFWVLVLGASCSNKLFVGTLRPSHQNEYTVRAHTFIIWELTSNCTGHMLHRALWQELICVIRPPCTHELSRNYFPIACTSVTQKKCFRIVCVIISGLIVVEPSLFQREMTSSDVFGFFLWRLHRECPKYMQFASQRKREEKTGKPETLSPAPKQRKSYSSYFWVDHRLDEQSGRLVAWAWVGLRGWI